jgi:hypothetical protein
MKRGMNFSDINRLKNGLRAGRSIEAIARECSTFPEVVRKYMDSMDPAEVEKLRASAPADGADIESIKAQLKAELMEELYGSVEEEAQTEVPEDAA